MARNIACICEGGAEQCIIQILLDNCRLKFKNEELIGECLLPTKYRNHKKFENDYLDMARDKPITIYLIQDSHKVEFKVGFLYQKQIEYVYYVVTSPEIEMLLIISEKKKTNGIKFNLK